MKFAILSCVIKRTNCLTKPDFHNKPYLDMMIEEIGEEFGESAHVIEHIDEAKVAKWEARIAANNFGGITYNGAYVLVDGLNYQLKDKVTGAPYGDVKHQMRIFIPTDSAGVPKKVALTEAQRVIKAAFVEVEAVPAVVTAPAVA
jgi:hypothetical protein